MAPLRKRRWSHSADGQWHHFGKEGGSNSSHPTPSHPPQNRPGHAGNWLRRYKDLPPAQQHRALENDPQFRKLSPQQQARLRSRLQNFSSLPPQQHFPTCRRSSRSASSTAWKLGST
ncbi:MAG: DUF3106 domain-containing protein [Terriglobales bacterium]